MSDYFLIAVDEYAMWAALEAAGLGKRQDSVRLVLVSNATLERVLDRQLLDGDLQCVYDGKTYRAQHGKWYEVWPMYAPVGISLDVIGEIYKPTGEIAMVDGIETPVTAAIPGYHANIRGELTAEQAAALPLVPAPLTPYRVWS